MASGLLRAAAPDPGNQTVRLSEVEVVSSKMGSSALMQAPTESQFTVTEPQSVINLNYIANTVAPTADYATIANIAPNVANVETNGPGLSESKHLTMRGFDDAQYNVTFDGIPFGDINDFSHHTTSYFPAKLLGKVVVDRGPGSAADVGYATFGGTIALYSKDPRTDAAFIPTLSFGSWHTFLGHFEVNTGLLPSLNNASAIFSYQRMRTDGYQTFSGMNRDTYYLKYLQPIGRNTQLTFLSSYNRIHFNKPGKPTQEIIDTLGRNFGLNNDPASTHYYGYNYQDKQTDFEYLGLDTRWGEGWSLNDKLYTYYYNLDSREKPKIKSGDVLGRYKVNRYRTWGNYLSIANAGTSGTFTAGLWIDYSRNPRFRYSLNFTTLGPTAIDTTSTTQWKAVNGDPSTIGWNYKMVDWLRTFQPFAEYEWHPARDLAITPGIKYVSFTRDLEAPVNATGPREPLYYNQTTTQTLPYLAANYRIDPTWSAYAQVAEGFLGPNLHDFYIADPSKNTIKPEETMNYQAGTVYKTGQFNADADVYYIDFTNYEYAGPNDANGDPLYYGVAKGAYYSGVEAEATYSLGGGVSVYGNGAIADAKFKGSKMDVPTVPKDTAALGLVYDHDGFFGSFTDKYVGSWAVYDNITNPDIPGGGAARRADSQSYWIANLSVGYSVKFAHSFFRSMKIRFQVGDLFNKAVQVLDSIDSNPANAYTKDSFNVLPTRNYFLTVSGVF